MSLNKCLIIGNVGNDPQVKYFDNGNSIASFSVAVNERGYKLANGTEIPERTEWFNVLAKKEQAQFVEKYVKKGSGLYVEGKIRTRSYENGGVKRYVTELHADKVEFFSFGKKNTENAGSSTSAAAQPNQGPQETNAFNGAQGGVDDNDMPF